MLSETDFTGSVLVESSQVTNYTYGGGKSGLMYTCNGGFIDFGHLFDNVDLTWYYNYYLTKLGMNVAGKHFPLLKHNGNPQGTVTIKAPIPAADCALTAASIAYDWSVYYEMKTYWEHDVGHHNSAFSPEDLVSNYTGVRISATALEKARTTPGTKFHVAVNDELKRVLGLLGPRTKAQTHAALMEIDGKWVKNANSFFGHALSEDDYLIVRNFHYKSISPCFVSAAGIGCTGTPAYPSTLPLTFPPQIAGYYDVEYVPDHLAIQNKLGTKVKKSNFASLIAAMETDNKPVNSC